MVRAKTDLVSLNSTTCHNKNTNNQINYNHKKILICYCFIEASMIVCAARRSGEVLETYFKHIIRNFFVHCMTTDHPRAIYKIA